MDSLQATAKIYPKKSRYTLASFIYSCLPLFVLIPVLWLIKPGSIDYLGICFYLAMSLVVEYIAYPYYTLSIDEEKVIGATVSGWLWHKEEIKLSEIDSERVLKQNPGRRVGITVIYSTRGKKILTLGLSDFQISQILEFSKGDNGLTKLV